MFKLYDKFINFTVCYLFNLVFGEDHSYLFEEQKEEAENKNPDQYIWTF